MSVGRYTYGTPEVLWKNPNASLYIVSFCSIAIGVKVFLGGNHRPDWVTTYPFGHVHHAVFNKFNGAGCPSTKGDVNIGNDVWISKDVTIMSGVTIGDGAVIATNSHVVKDVEPYSIVGGNPARHIRYRFSPTQIERLLRIKWWTWDDKKINDNVQYLCSDNIETFINMHDPIPIINQI